MTSNWIGQLDWENMLSLKVTTSSHWPPIYRFNDFIVITFCPLLKVWLNTLEMFPPVKEKLMLPEEGWRYVRELNYKWNCSTYFKNVLHVTLYSSQPSSARRVRALPVGLETSTSSSRFRTQIIMPFVFFSLKKNSCVICVSFQWWAEWGRVESKPSTNAKIPQHGRGVQAQQGESLISSVARKYSTGLEIHPAAADWIDARENRKRRKNGVCGSSGSQVLRLTCSSKSKWVGEPDYSCLTGVKH